MSEWQPIETAPKDGTPIWVPDALTAMKWVEGDGYALWIWADDDLSDIDPDPEQPTLWQPLPPPPREAGTTGERE